jgi:hypothetical protein
MVILVVIEAYGSLSCISASIYYEYLSKPRDVGV